MSDEILELVKEGCLGTCWYGNYHYVEPWAGCGFNCAYCYARFRTPVTEKLRQMGNSFSDPVPLFPPDRLYGEIKEAVTAKNVKIVKISRFTDIFYPRFVENGLSYQVLKALVDSPVERVIITTKGAPDTGIADMMVENAPKFSFNVVIKPETGVKLEGEIAPLEKRLEMARYLTERGVQVTVHMDPLVPGLEDEPGKMEDFLKILKKWGLNRVMFSYLLLNPPMIRYMRERMGSGIMDPILSLFDIDAVQVLPEQEETTYFHYRQDLRKGSINSIAEMLTRMEFDYVLCSLKSSRDKLKIDGKKCRLCDGKFYA